MNRFIRAVRDLDLLGVRALLERDGKWLAWTGRDGRNALHYLCGVNAGGDPARADRSLRILDLLLDGGMDIDSVQEIPDEGEVFPATPLWYAYARGRNEALYRHLLDRGAHPENCMFAIAWNDDVAAAELFLRFGASIDPVFGDSTPFFAAFLWRRFAAAEWFLQHGADVDHADGTGNTALFYAVKRRYDREHVSLLLEHGANPSRENADGVSPRGLAEQMRRRSVLVLLDAHGRS